jgi:hypothetical protein
MSHGFCAANTAGPQPVKLAELRAKTDLQILSIVHSKLELGLNFVALVEETYSGGSPDHPEQLLRRAEQAVAEVKQLLPVLKEQQRRGFGPTLKNLQERLDRLGSKLDVRNRESPAA